MSAPTNPRGIFGIHTVTPYNRATGKPYGVLKVLSSGGLSFSGKVVPLNGGSLKYPWAVEEGAISSQLSLKFSEYPDFVFQLFMGATPTENTADALGAVSTLTNKQGTSVMNATTGIASVGIITGSETDLKFGKYTVEAITATTVMVYCSTDADFGRGTVKTFQGDKGEIIAAAVTITASTGTNLTGFGFKLTGGSGTIGMTAGDTATFEVKPENTANMVMTIGAIESVFPEFGVILMAKKRGTGECFEIDVPRVKGEGTPIGLAPEKWSECDVKANIMYDTALNYVARFRQVVPTTAL